MKRLRFCLEGIGGVYNYGCEAIVRGTVSILRAFWPEAEIVYLSYRPGPDREVLGDVDAQVEDGAARKSRLRRAAKRFRTRLGIQTRPKGWQYAWAKKADCILSIGGDILTLWPNQKDAREFPQLRTLNAVLDRGRPVVLWGASVGPFEENPHATEAFSAVLKRLTLIVARETLTKQYVESLGVNAAQVGLAADPAFLLTASEDDELVARHSPSKGRPTLGVNLSPLSAEYTFDDVDKAEAARVHAAEIARTIETFDVDVLLIPHVICPWRPEDDDLGYLQGVKAALPQALAHRVRVLPPGLGARRTKGIIARCDALLAARMHCAIAGMSSGVPTLLLSYSPKAVGMGEYVYGDRQMVLPLNADEGSFLPAVSRLLEGGLEIREYLKSRMAEIREHAWEAGALLKEALRSNCR